MEKKIINKLPEAHCATVVHANLLIAYKQGAFDGFDIFGSVLVKPKVCRRTFSA